MEYYSAIKNEIMPSAATQMDLESVILTDWSRSNTGEISYGIPYMRNLKRNDATELTYKKNRRLTDLEKELMVARWKCIHCYI